MSLKEWFYGFTITVAVLFLIVVAFGCAAVRSPAGHDNPADGDAVPSQAYSPDHHCDKPGFGHNPYYLYDPNDGSSFFLFCF
jgi:hypothetical protein